MKSFKDYVKDPTIKESLTGSESEAYRKHNTQSFHVNFNSDGSPSEHQDFARAHKVAAKWHYTQSNEHYSNPHRYKENLASHHLKMAKRHESQVGNYWDDHKVHDIK